MDIDVLRRFVHIARLGNVTQAAEDLHISQPALSKQIRRMEEELGAKLFCRNGRGIRLTSAGRTFLQYCHNMLSAWGEAKQAVQEEVQQKREQIRLITFVTFAFYLLPNFLVDFCKRYPNLEIEIEQAIKEPVVQQVLERHFDAGIATLPVGHPGLDEIPLYMEESVLIVNRDHPLYGRKVLPASEVGEHLLITSSLNATYRAFLWSVLQNQDVQLKVKYIVHYYPNVINMVKAGLGAGLAPIVALNSVDKEDGSISIIRIDPPLQRKLGWIELKGIKRAPGVQTFFNYLVDHLRKQDLVPSLI
jgi:LysR family transcriptional regulator, carnitine catabolism transcriptional activator